METKDHADTLFGLPTENLHSDSIEQQYADTCAIKSQEIIMNSVGFNVSEEELRNEAYQNGWYAPNMGTPMEDVGKLMENHGLDVTQTQNASMYNLVSELSKGHPVIVGVDSGELWESGPQETFEDVIQGPQADHALIVSGIDFNDDFTDGTVNVIDPGTGDYCAGYPLSQFEDAWDDSDDFMVSIN